VSLENYETTTKAARRLNTTIPTIIRWIKAGYLPAERFGRDYLIPAGAELDTSSAPKVGRPVGGKNYGGAGTMAEIIDKTM